MQVHCNLDPLYKCLIENECKMVVVLKSLTNKYKIHRSLNQPIEMNIWQKKYIFI